jgi:hypothetical protein
VEEDDEGVEERTCTGHQYTPCGNDYGNTTCSGHQNTPWDDGRREEEVGVIIFEGFYTPWSRGHMVWSYDISEDDATANSINSRGSVEYNEFDLVCYLLLLSYLFPLIVF